MNRDQDLRERLVTELEHSGVLTDAAVAAAMRAVPRHRFMPGAPLEDAYRDRAFAIKERDGRILSSISQPGMIVQMLQLLAVAPGNAILEIGTGSGYNAALLATLCGPQGRVVSVEIESDLAAAARENLRALEIRNVEIVHEGALAEIGDHFDRIIVTAKTDDIEGAWWRVLRNGGRLVVPLDIGFGGERVVGFVRDGDRLHSIGSYACAFIGIRTGIESQAGEIFFRNQEIRYRGNPSARAPLDMVAMPRASARPELLSEADAVIARPVTIFAVTQPSQA